MKIDGLGEVVFSQEDTTFIAYLKEQPSVIIEAKSLDDAITELKTVKKLFENL